MSSRRPAKKKGQNVAEAVKEVVKEVSKRISGAAAGSLSGLLQPSQQQAGNEDLLRQAIAEEPAQPGPGFHTQLPTWQAPTPYAISTQPHSLTTSQPLSGAGIAFPIPVATSVWRRVGSVIGVLLLAWVLCQGLKPSAHSQQLARVQSALTQQTARIDSLTLSYQAGFEQLSAALHNATASSVEESSARGSKHSALEQQWRSTLSDLQALSSNVTELRAAMGALNLTVTTIAQEQATRAAAAAQSAAAQAPPPQQPVPPPAPAPAPSPHPCSRSAQAVPLVLTHHSATAVDKAGWRRLHVGLHRLFRDPWGHAPPPPLPQAQALFTHTGAAGSECPCVLPLLSSHSGPATLALRVRGDHAVRGLCVAAAPCHSPGVASAAPAALKVSVLPSQGGGAEWVHAAEVVLGPRDVASTGSLTTNTATQAAEAHTGSTNAEHAESSEWVWVPLPRSMHAGPLSAMRVEMSVSAQGTGASVVCAPRMWAVGAGAPGADE